MLFLEKPLTLYSLLTFKIIICDSNISRYFFNQPTNKEPKLRKEDGEECNGKILTIEFTV